MQVGDLSQDFGDADTLERVVIHVEELVRSLEAEQEVERLLSDAERG